jgi:hypothetical protein
MTTERMTNAERSKIEEFVEVGHMLSQDQASALLAEADRAGASEEAQAQQIQAKDAEISRITKERETFRADAVDALKAMISVMEVLTPNAKEPAIDAARRVVAERDALRADLERLKPSGPVAEDVAFVEECVGVSSDHWSRPRTERARSTISRLATFAQTAQAKDETIKALVEALRNLRCVAVSQGVSEQHGVIINADAALAGVLK